MGGVLAPRGWMERVRAMAAVPGGRARGVLWISEGVAEGVVSFGLPVVPLLIQEEFGVTGAGGGGLWAGALGGALAITMGVMGPVWGALADRFGRKLMVQRALFGAGCAIGAMSLARTPEHLLALRVIQGSLTGVVVATTTMVSLMVPRRHLGSSLGLMHAALFAGGAVGPVIGGAFADAFGYRATFAATAVVFFVSGSLVSLFVPEPSRERVAEAAVTGTPGSADDARPSPASRGGAAAAARAAGGGGALGGD